MKSVAKFIALFSRWLNGIGLAVTLPVIVGLITVDVFGRKFLNRPLTGADEIAGYGLAIMTYASLSYCWVTGGHIRLDMLINKLRPRLRQACEALSAAAWLLFFCPLVLWLIYFVIPENFAQGEIGVDSGLPLWPFKAFIAFGASVFCMQLLVSFLTAIIRMVKNGES